MSVHQRSSKRSRDCHEAAMRTTVWVSWRCHASEHGTAMAVNIPVSQGGVAEYCCTAAAVSSAVYNSSTWYTFYMYPVCTRCMRCMMCGGVHCFEYLHVFCASILSSFLSSFIVHLPETNIDDTASLLCETYFNVYSSSSNRMTRSSC